MYGHYIREFFPMFKVSLAACYYFPLHSYKIKEQSHNGRIHTVGYKPLVIPVINVESDTALPRQKDDIGRVSTETAV